MDTYKCNGCGELFDFYDNDNKGGICGECMKCTNCGCDGDHDDDNDSDADTILCACGCGVVVQTKNYVGGCTCCGCGEQFDDKCCKATDKCCGDEHDPEWGHRLCEMCWELKH